MWGLLLVELDWDALFVCDLDSVAWLSLNTLQPAPLFSISLLNLREFELWQIRKWIKVVQTLDFLGVKKIMSKQIFQ